MGDDQATAAMAGCAGCLHALLQAALVSLGLLLAFQPELLQENLPILPRSHETLLKGLAWFLLLSSFVIARLGVNLATRAVASPGQRAYAAGCHAKVLTAVWVVLGWNILRTGGTGELLVLVCLPLGLGLLGAWSGAMSIRRGECAQASSLEERPPTSRYSAPLATACLTAVVLYLVLETSPARAQLGVRGCWLTAALLLAGRAGMAWLRSAKPAATGRCLVGLASLWAGHVLVAWWTFEPPPASVQAMRLGIESLPTLALLAGALWGLLGGTPARSGGQSSSLAASDVPSGVVESL
ncbi:MAG: hypothetical protein AB1758_31595 [Candidatus Eremiobacterota bacterium]